MNYITEILAFYDYIESNPQITDTCICLWYALMYQANKTGWQSEFSVAISTLKLRTSLSKDAIYRARNKLKQFGLIDFKERTGNQSANYILKSLVSFKQTQSATHYATQTASQSATQTATQTANINKLNETKQNKTRDNEESEKEINSFSPPPHSQPQPENISENAEKANNINKGGRPPKVRKKSEDMTRDECLYFLENDSTYEFSAELRDSVKDWVEYKYQRNQPYVPIGFKSQLTEIDHKRQKYGELAVTALISLCISNGWKGIIWDKLTEKANVTGPPVKQEEQKSYTELIAEARKRGEIP